MAAEKKGWKKLSTGGKAPFVIWKVKNQSIHGKITAKGSYNYKGKKHSLIEFVNMATGEIGALADNYGLRGLLAEKVGTEFRVKFLGVKKLKGKQTLKEFVVEVRS